MLPEILFTRAGYVRIDINKDTNKYINKYISEDADRDIHAADIHINNSSITVYRRGYEETCDIIYDIDYHDTSKTDRGTIENIERYVTGYLSSEGFNTGNSLYIIETYSEYIAREIMMPDKMYIVYDTYAQKLFATKEAADVFQMVLQAIQYYVSNGEIYKQVHDEAYNEAYNNGYNNRQYGYCMDDGANSKPPLLKRLLNINNLIILINIIAFIYMEINGSTNDTEYMIEHGALWISAMYGAWSEWYRIITSMFMHIGFGHLANNMVMLFFIGQILEECIGSVRYGIIYMLTGIISGIASYIYYLYYSPWTMSCGASGAIMGMIGALLCVVIANKGFYKGITARRMLFLTILCIYTTMTDSQVNWVAHISGLVSGIIIMAVWIACNRVFKRHEL